MIKWVVFDLDDTLFNATNLVQKARRASVQMMVDYGLPVDVDYAMKLLNEIVQEFGSNNEKHLDNLLIRLQNDPLYHLSPKFNINKYVAAGVMGYHREKVKHFRPFKDVIKSLQKIRQMGYKTAIITDGMPKKQYEKILRLKIEPYFDKIVISDEVGVRKPNKAIFELFLDQVNCSPDEVVYIGDRVDKDIIPAKEAGLWTVLIHRGTKHDPNVTKRKYSVRPHFHINSLNELVFYLKSNAFEKKNGPSK